MSEVKTKADKPILDYVYGIEDKEVEYGTPITEIELMNSVYGMGTDGKWYMMNISWDTSTYNPEQEGEQTIYGTLTAKENDVDNPNEVKAEMKIIVGDKPINIDYLNDLKDVETIQGTPFGELGLSNSAWAMGDDSKWHLVYIEWNEEEYDSQKVGEQLIHGKLLPDEDEVKNNNNVQAQVKIIVKSGEPEPLEIVNIKVVHKYYINDVFDHETTDNTEVEIHSDYTLIPEEKDGFKLTTEETILNGVADTDLLITLRYDKHIIIEPDEIELASISSIESKSVAYNTPFEEIGISDSVYGKGVDGEWYLLYIQWDSSGYIKTLPGEQTIYGYVTPDDDNVVNPKGLKAKLIITVKEEEIIPNPNIVKVDKPQDKTVTFATPFFELGLPDTVTVKSDDDQSHTVSVSWNMSEYNAYQSGYQTITGKISTPQGIDNRDSLNVSVKIYVMEEEINEDDKFGPELMRLISLTEVNEHFKVIHDGVELEPRGAKRTVNGSLYKSNMTKFEVEVFGSHDLVGKELNIQRGLSHPDIDNGTIHWIDYGNFVIEENEFDTLEEVTTIQASDYMIKSQVPYKKEDMALTFPKTVGEVFKRVVEVIGTDTTTTSFRNADVVLDYDLWADTSYTYRDVLDHIAELSSSIISVKDNKIEITRPIETGIKLDINKMKQIDLGDTYGNVNIVNITQEPQHSNTPYPKNWTEIPVDDRKELAFENNPIFDTNQERYGEIIFPQVNDLTYKEIKSETFGYGVFEVGDIVEVPDPQTGDTFKTVLSFEETDFGSFPQSEQRFEKPIQAQDDYVVETDEKRIAQETYILVDKANGRIDLVTQDVGELNEDVSKIELSLDEIKLLMEQRNTTNLWTNSSGAMGIDGYEFDVEPIKMNDIDYPMIMGVQQYTMGRKDPLFQAIPYKSIANNALSIERDGSAISMSRRLKFNEKVYFHTKIHGERYGTNKVSFMVIEFNKDKQLIQERTLGSYTPTGNMYHFKREFMPHTDTSYLQVKIVARGTPKNPIILTDGMMSYKTYVEYIQPNAELLEYTKSQIEMLDSQIGLSVEKIDALDGDIHNAGVEINADNGVTTFGKKFSVMNSERTKELLGVTTVNGEETINIDVSGGNLGNMALDNGTMVLTSPEYERRYQQSDLSAIKDIIMTGRFPNSYEKYIYDINKDGEVTSSDYVRIKNFMETGSPEITLPIIQSQVELGNNQGEIISRVLYNNGKKGNETLIQADSIQTGTIEAKGLSIGGKSIEIDENGWLKAV